MYTILIADDEDYVRELLSKSITRSGKPYTVVATAENGLEALALVKRHQPDILLTDIGMPHMNGLELIQALEAEQLPVKSVIISGYDDFAYAKTAMGLGVADYLLKPFLPAEMFGVLDRVAVTLEKEREQTSIQTQFEANVQYLRERFLTELLTGPIDRDAFYESATQLGIDLDGTLYTVGMLHLSAEDGMGGVSAAAHREAETYLSQYAAELFPKSLDAHFVRLAGNQLALLLVARGMQQAGLHRATEQALTKAAQQLEALQGVTLWCCMGGICSGRQDIHASCAEAAALWQRTLFSTGRVVWHGDAATPAVDVGAAMPQRPRELEERLLVQVQMNREAQALGILDEILAAYAAHAAAGQVEFVRMCLAELVFSLSSAMEKLGSHASVWQDESMAAYLQRHFTTGSLQEAQNALRDYVRRCCAAYGVVGQSQGEKIVAGVKELVEQNIGNEDFSLETVASALFFSTNYIRQIFRQIGGESFMEYVIRRRMDTAASLLAQPESKVQDVAFAAGYSNQRYFASCFKKYYGCTPTDYKKRMQQKE